MFDELPVRELCAYIVQCNILHMLSCGCPCGCIKVVSEFVPCLVWRDEAEVVLHVCLVSGGVESVNVPVLCGVD